jgi:hypothetical protein
MGNLLFVGSYGDIIEEKESFGKKYLREKPAADFVCRR